MNQKIPISPSGAEEEDDRPTVVINIADLKKTSSLVEPQINLVPEVDISFNLDQDSSTEQAPSLANEKNECYVYFSFKKSFDSKIFSHLKQHGSIIQMFDLNELNQKIKTKEKFVLFFTFSEDPQKVNILCAQIKSKFPHIHTVIIAKNLSPDKKSKHQESKSGANTYLDSDSGEDSIESFFQHMAKNYF